jgi:hypothetical protein
VFERLFHHKREMRAFGAIAIIVLAFVTMLFDGIVEHFLGFLNLHSNFGQIGQFHGGPVLFNKILEIQSVEMQIRILGFKTFLWEVERLLHQIGVGIVHWALGGVGLGEQKNVDKSNF